MGKGDYDNQGYPQGYAQDYPQDYSQGYPQSYPMNSYNQPITSATGGAQNSSNTNIIQVGAQQQPQHTTVVLQKNEPMPGMCGNICFSCIVFWFCNAPGVLFGCIAFFIAIGGLNASSPAHARELGHASLGMNITGLLLGIILWILLALLLTGVLHFAFFTAWFYN